MKFHFLGLSALCLFTLVGLDGVTHAQTNQRKSAVTATQGRGNKPVATTRKTATRLPTVDQVLGKYIVALGGKAAIQRLTSRIITGTFELPARGLKGSITIKSKAPNQSFSHIDLNGIGVIVQVCNGKEGFVADSTSGVRQLTGEELVTTQIQSIFHQNIRLKEIYKKIEVTGKEKVGETDAVTLIATPPLGSPEKMYFDLASGLLLREESERVSPQGKTQTVTMYEDYRTIDGVNIPHVVKTVTPLIAFVIRKNQIKHNIPIEDSVFLKPDIAIASNYGTQARTRPTVPRPYSERYPVPQAAPRQPARPVKPVRLEAIGQASVYSSPGGQIIGKVESGSVLIPLSVVMDGGIRWYLVEPVVEGDMHDLGRLYGRHDTPIASGWVYDKQVIVR